MEADQPKSFTIWGRMKPPNPYSATGFLVRWPEVFKTKMPLVKPNHGSTHPSPPAAVALLTGYTVNLFREEFLVKNPALAPFHSPQGSARKGLRECSNRRHRAIHHSQPLSCPAPRKALSDKENQIRGAFCLQRAPGAGANECGTRGSRCAAPETCGTGGAGP